MPSDADGQPGADLFTPVNIVDGSATEWGPTADGGASATHDFVLTEDGVKKVRTMMLGVALTEGAQGAQERRLVGCECIVVAGLLGAVVITME